VRERYWLTFAPGEIRSCTSCHGINVTDQAQHSTPTNTPIALIKLLDYWKTNVAVVQASLATGLASDYLQLKFTRRPAESSVTYHVQASPDLKTWSDIASYTGTNSVLSPRAVEVSRTGSPTETIVVRDTSTAQTNPTRFLRVKVTRP